MPTGPRYVPPRVSRSAPNKLVVRDHLAFEIEQERWRHEDAMYRFGEYSMFVLLWHIADFEAGLVDRCHLCYLAEGDVTEVYQQPARRNCRSCYGTTFEDGWKARLVRPSLWDIGAEDAQERARGEIVTNTAQVQSTFDFRMRSGDYIFRGDSTRWQVQGITVSRVHSGFQTVDDRDNAIAWNYSQVSQEDKSSVAYEIMPSVPEVTALLNPHAPRREPADFSVFDVIRPGVSLL